LLEARIMAVAEAERPLTLRMSRSIEKYAVA
jgi:hypothetical protein